MLKREIRISIFGVYQFTVSADQDEPMEAVARRAAATMKLEHLRYRTASGMIDFRP